MFFSVARVAMMLDHHAFTRMLPIDAYSSAIKPAYLDLSDIQLNNKSSFTHLKNNGAI